ncbi:MAG: hypothetical protein ACR2OV_09455, partial [Hyphomicrobiaceae bacterium]
LVRPDGETIRSMRERDDDERLKGQRALLDRMKAMTAERPWDPVAINRMARYVALNDGRDRAMTALTYAIALPFLPPDQTPAVTYDEQYFARIYAQNRLLSHARSPVSLLGFVLRRLGSDRRVQRRLLDQLGGDDYGLHAVMITLDNAMHVLDSMCDIIEAQTPREARNEESLKWLAVRTAPRQVIRQVPESFTLPFVRGRVPANSIVIMRMRDSLTTDTPSGYGFAAAHWSACPAQAYIHALFETVAEQARLCRAGEPT